MSVLHFPVVKLYLPEDKKGRGWGKRRRRRNVREKPGADSAFCSPAVCPQSNYLNSEPLSHL